MATKRLPRRNRRTRTLLGLVLSTGLCLGALASATPAAASASIFFSPTSGAPGTSVVIIGSGVSFDATSTVMFGQTLAVANVVSSSQINAIVPDMPSSSVAITVHTGSTAVRGATSFKVVPGLVLTPSTGPPGTAVSVSGGGFGKVVTISLSFDGTTLTSPAPVTNSSGSFGPVSIKVPAAVIAGSHTISAKGGTPVLTAQAVFTVTPAIVLSPAAGPPGSAVKVSGTGFGKAEKISLSFDGTTLTSPAPVTNSSGSFGPTSITVPAAVTAGSHTISALGGTTGLLAHAAFTVTPKIVVSPGTGPPGTSVSVSGVGFGPSEGVDVYFDATDLTLADTGATGSFGPVSITVPGSAVPGTHTVSAQGRQSGAFAQATFTVTPAPAPTIVVSPATGPPGSAVQVSGAGFGPSEGVDVYFDTTDLALADTGATGSFGPVSITVPGSAVPGTHTVSAQGRRSGGFAQASLTVNTNWTEFHYSAKHKGANPFENVLSPGNVSGIDQDWSFTTGGSVSSSPAVVNGVVYVGSDDTNLYALSATGGSKLWSFATGGNVFSPAVANGVVYTVGNGDVYALNAATGAQQWTQPIGADSESPPTVANGTVYVGLGAGVYAFDAATGAQLWTFSTDEVVDGAPTVTNGVVYVGSVDGNLYALNATTGTELWKFSPAGSEVETSPAVADGVVYVAADNGNIDALNATTGTEIWSVAIGSSIFSSPAVANGVLYVGSDDGNVYALNAATGTQLWTFTTGGSVSSSPAVANGVVYVGSSDGNVYALDAATGDRLWSFTTGGAVNSSPAVVNGVVYVGSSDGNLYAFDLAGGQAVPARPSRSSLHPNYGLRPQHRQQA